MPRERLSDLRAQMAANRLGVARMQALCAKYGTETVLAAGAALLDYAERKMRAGIAAIPDGVWRFEDVHDSPEIEGSSRSRSSSKSRATRCACISTGRTRCAPGST